MVYRHGKGKLIFDTSKKLKGKIDKKHHLDIFRLKKQLNVIRSCVLRSCR